MARSFRLTTISLFSFFLNLGLAHAESDAQLYRRMLSCYQPLTENAANAKGISEGDKANSFLGPGKMGQAGTVLILPGTHQSADGRQSKGVFVLPLDTLDQLGVQAAFASTSSPPPPTPGVTLSPDDPDVQYEFQIKNGRNLPINFKYIQHTPQTDRFVGNCTLQTTLQAPTSARAKNIDNFEYSGPEVLTAFVQEITRRVVNDTLTQEMTGPFTNTGADVAEKNNDLKQIVNCEKILSDKRSDPDFKALFAAFDKAPLPNPALEKGTKPSLPSGEAGPSTAPKNSNSGNTNSSNANTPSNF